MIARIPIGQVAHLNPRAPSDLLAAGDREVSFVPMSHLSEAGAVISNGPRRVREVSKGYTFFANGDVLLAKITPCMENGKAAYVHDLPHGVGFGSTEFHVLRAGPKLDARYLFYMIWNPTFRRAAEKNMTGSAGQKRVPRDFVERFEIPLPPLADQRRLADILDKANKVTQKQRTVQGLFSNIGVSAFAETLSALDGDYSTVPLGQHVVEFRYGTSIKSAPQGRPTLRIPNVLHGELDFSDVKNVPVEDSEFNRLQLKDGDMLFVRTNGNPDYVGRCAVFDAAAVSRLGFNPADFVYASYLIRARLDHTMFHPVFVQYALATNQGRRALRDHSRTSAGQYNINTDGLGQLPIPRPSIAIQRQFAESISKLDNSRMAARQSSKVAAELFDALLYRAFQGDL